MILIVSVIVMIIGLILHAIYDTNISVILAACGVMTLSMSVLFGIINYGFINDDLYDLKNEYNSLKYQYESNIYDGNEILKAELIMNIKEYNDALSSNKKYQRDFWIGVLIPNIYDDLEFIPLKGE